MWLFLRNPYSFDCRTLNRQSQSVSRGHDVILHLPKNLEIMVDTFVQTIPKLRYCALKQHSFLTSEFPMFSTRSFHITVPFCLLPVLLISFVISTSAVFISELHGEDPGNIRLKNWHQWRGPDATGVSRDASPPTQWSEETNIRWKVAVEGEGSSTPIIWQDRVFLLTAIDTGIVDPSLPTPEDQPDRAFGIKFPNTEHQFVVLCLDRKTGQERWRQVATQHVPHEGHHQDNDFASGSPTTDGERVYCWFGSAGLFCYDMNGNKLWQRDLGKAYMAVSLGEGCSPVLHNDKLIIQRDHQQQSVIEVLDAKTGQTLWKANREERSSWATPVVVEYAGHTQVITAASGLVRSYDLDDGSVIWQCSGLTGNVTPCPVVDENAVYCMSGYQGYSIMALPLSAVGDISGSDQILWTGNRGTPYVPSPVLYDGLLFFNQSNQGIWTCLDAVSGETLMGRTRLPGISNIFSSPVAAAGHIYITDRDGTTLVVKRSKTLEVVGSNKLDDTIDSSAAIAGNELYLRGRKYVYCIADGSRP